MPSDVKLWGPKDLEGAWSDLAVNIQETCGMNAVTSQTRVLTTVNKIRILTGPPTCFALDKMGGMQCIHSNRFGLYIGSRW